MENFDQLSPDDLQAVMALAGPLYQASRQMEAYTVDNPLVNAQKDDGSLKIRKGLEQAERLVNEGMRQQHEQYMAQHHPQPAYQPAPVYYEQPQQMLPPQPQQMVAVAPVPQDNQMEFSFDRGKQDVTNDLLKDILLKLNKIIIVLEKQRKEPIRLK